MTLRPEYDPVLVTGAAGFVGQGAVRRLLRDGYTVHALVRPGAELWRFAGVRERVVLHAVDVREAVVSEIVRAIRPSVVIHAATHGAYECQADAPRILATNVLGTSHVLQAALAARTRLFVNLGSSSEYGSRDAPLRESMRPRPQSVYGLAKAAQTDLCRLLGRGTDTAVVTLRLFSVFGPWEDPHRLWPTVIRRVRAGLPLHLVAPETARDFIALDDVLDLLLDFDALWPLGGEILNVGSGTQSTVRDAVEVVQGILGRRADVRWGALPPRPWDTDRWQADMSKVRRLLGWSPRLSLRDGARRLADWMCTVGDDYGPRTRPARRSEMPPRAQPAAPGSGSRGVPCHGGRAAAVDR